jgi:ParB family transcriptional regulator, chromosome partitioning protein
MLKPSVDAAQLPEMIETRLIKPSKNQLREGLGNIDDLMGSISSSGLLCPIIVRPSGAVFEVVAGNRRFEACKKLRMTSILAIVRPMDDKEAFELSIAENVQRSSLSILEEAMAFKKYVEDFGWGSVSELADKLGKSPAYVSHHISFLKLPNIILKKLESGDFNQSVAQEFLWVKDQSTQLRLAELGSMNKLSVRQVRLATKELRDEYDDPFGRKWVRRRSTTESALLDKAILSLRIAMVRIDSYVERAQSKETRKSLIQIRFGIHKIIDETLAQKKMLENS